MGKTTNILDLNNRLTKVEKENVAQNSYTSLKNKPKINNVTLTGNKSLADLGAAAAADLTTLAGNVGDKAQLNTTDKSSMVAAINEVNEKVGLKSNPLKVVTKNGTVAEVPAGSNLDFSIPIIETGYTPIGVVGVIVSGSGKLAVINTFIDSGQTTATVRLVNNGTNAITPTSIQTNILYIKND